MREFRFPTAAVFRPLLEPARYKGAYGGRGSGKSHFFAGAIVERALVQRGFRGLGFREVQRSLQESSKKLIEDKIREFGLGPADGFKIFREVIQTPGDGVIIFKGLQDHTAESVKSFEGIDVAWGEEAQTTTAHSLDLLRPTIRKSGSEIWLGWNPRFSTDAVDKMFRGNNPPSGTICVEANWRDNPWFPRVLEQERLDCLNNEPDQYNHIWEGGYATVFKDAYYAAALSTARLEKRIGIVTADPLIRLRAYFDIGGTGQNADATVIWIVQFISREIRVLDYYEAVGQPLAAHVNWLRENKYENVLCVLPHDGSNANTIFSTTWGQQLEQAGFDVRVIKNQGAGAARLRIEAARRLFPMIWFNESKVGAGLEMLGRYHPKKDEQREIDLGPVHDKSSHAADAFGMMAIDYEAPETGRVEPKHRKRFIL